MKTSFFSLLLLVLVGACKPQSEETNAAQGQVKDSTITGSDKDENGCLASAGYTWSKLNKECVRMFTGLQLNPVDQANTEDETLASYVLFSEDRKQAEVFLPNQESMVLTRAGEGSPWVKNDYQLVAWKGFIFKKGDTTLYAGDGEIGQKVTGSADPEAE
ncbi:hypothetical protein [Flavobacterium sp.]|jgi:hypothetical protein|uniref:hypothetical protein n=1 Tax=Flavobacterium sp. TaxID=239 RepID=UPI0026284CDD|nr:hypothetical protein [Flavobacterium sp.]